MLPREIHPGTTYLLTRRCIDRKFLLRPSALTNQIIEYCLALASQRTGVQVHAFCAMSNHVHQVVTDVQGTLPDFLRLFHRNVAIALNASLGRSGVIWAPGATSVVELGDEADILDKMAYAIANPVKAALVRWPAEWPGVLLQSPGEIRVVERPIGFFRNKGAMPDQVHLRCEPPPQLARLSLSDLNTRLSCVLESHIDLAQRQNDAAALPYLGAEEVRRQSLTQAATTRERPRERQPRFAMRDPQRKRTALERWKAFLRAYRESFQRWRSGVRGVTFPAGTWQLCQTHGVERPPGPAIACGTA